MATIVEYEDSVYVLYLENSGQEVCFTKSSKTQTFSSFLLLPVDKLQCKTHVMAFYFFLPLTSKCLSE